MKYWASLATKFQGSFWYNWTENIRFLAKNDQNTYDFKENWPFKLKSQGSKSGFLEISGVKTPTPGSNGTPDIIAYACQAVQLDSPTSFEASPQLDSSASFEACRQLDSTANVQACSQFDSPTSVQTCSQLDSPTSFQACGQLGYMASV